MARVNRYQKFSGWPSWRYGPEGQAQIFQTEHEVPNGWTKKPFVPDTITDVVRVAPEVLDRDAIVAELLDRQIPFHHARSTSYLKGLL